MNPIATVPRVVLECAGDFRVTILEGNRVRLELQNVEKETVVGDIVYDKRGLAKRLNTSQRSIDNWMRAKKNPLPYIRTGGRPKFRESDVQWWLSQGCSVSARRASAKLESIIVGSH